MTSTAEGIANSWVRYHLLGAEVDYWAIEALNELISKDPLAAWKVICEINSHPIDETWLEFVDGCIGAGPLESLIALHGETILTEVLNEASCSDRLRRQLAVIYESSIGVNNWKKIRNLNKRTN